MIVDGRAIAQDLIAKIRTAVAQLPRPPKLAIVISGDDPASRQFVRIKVRRAAEVGIETVVSDLAATAGKQAIIDAIEGYATDEEVDGIVLQLPLPSGLTPEVVVSHIPKEKDIDFLRSDALVGVRTAEAKILPPVAGAIMEILEHTHVDVAGKEVLVLGHGRLVGAPAALLMRHNQAHVTVIDQPVADLAVCSREADVIISGAGKTGIVRPEMLKDGVVLIDAGTSESGGSVKGDIDPHCASKASVYTPVPGGVGPITVAILLKNCYLVSRKRQRSA